MSSESRFALVPGTTGPPGVLLFEGSLRRSTTETVHPPSRAEEPDGNARGYGAVDIRCLLEQARRLRDRLHRLTVVLALTEEFVADALDDLASQGGSCAESQRACASRAREGAQACRDLDARVGELPALDSILGR